MGDNAIDWAATNADPRFQELHRRKAGFLSLLMIVSVVYYFMLPVGAAWFPELFRIRVAGVVNVGLLFALSQFLVAWGVAALYTRRANREFDRLAEEINREIGDRHLRGAVR
ncbi:MAG: DUF485 domain-containing protein [Rhodocyclales bacterium]|nr:DUF485 domain-containing protein [Rhodocyclales bacterium]